MTFCLGVTLKDGIIAIADTRLTTGSECTTAQKMYMRQKGNNSMFVMTSGLRSLRDKVLTYLEEALDDNEESFDKLYKVMNALGNEIRQVADEDQESLVKSGLQFNIHCIVGGQFNKDNKHKLFLIYPQGNWVEISEGTPYHIIGATGYGKPVLDRTLKYTDSIKHALKVSMLAFDSTRISSNDVDYPMDIAIYPTNSYQIHRFRLYKEDLQEIATWWQDRLRNSVNDIPSQKIDEIVSQIKEVLPNG
ncbi:MAG: hypothetical protein WC197_05875 [Candidatus Gastranaerophilaceae bacterium]|jgi:putative proteasome-type protease